MRAKIDMKTRHGYWSRRPRFLGSNKYSFLRKQHLELANWHEISDVDEGGWNMLPALELVSEPSAAAGKQQSKKISVIVPIYNEEVSIDPLLHALHRVLQSLGRDYEIIAINDGSTDRSYERLAAAAALDSALKVVNFRRNFGQTAAIMAGIHYSSGGVLLFICAGLQNYPEDIPRLLNKLDEGEDGGSRWSKDRRRCPLD